MRIALVIALAGCGGSANPQPIGPASSAPATPASIVPTDAGSASDGDDAGSRAAYVFRPPADDSTASGDNTDFRRSGTGVGTGGHGSGVGTGTGMRPRGPGPNITLAQADIGDGGLDPTVVRRYLKRHVMRLQYCYERVLEHKPGLVGTVIATFTIGADGLVSKSDATGVDPDVASCMIAVIRDLEFPKAARDTAVRYPIEVHPS